MTAAPINRPIAAEAGYSPIRVGPETLAEACAKLIGASAGPVGRAAAQRFIGSAAQQGIDLSRFWIVQRPRSKRHLAAALLAPSNGGTGMLFVSDPVSAEETRALSAAIEAACAEPEGVRLAQSLIEPGHPAIRRAVERCGFQHVGDLKYMRRPWKPVEPSVEPTPLPAGVTLAPWAEGDDDDVLAALERSYIDTLDCPELCGLRATEDVLASHRGAGVWKPELWWVVRLHGAPEGVALFNEFPDQGHAELVYLGLGPDLRGNGIGGHVLRHGLRALATRVCREVTCAVDARNTPATSLYERHGFRPFADRVAFVKTL